MTKSNNQIKVKFKPKRFHDHLQGKEGQILLATFQCIVEKGIAGTSTHAVAARAGLNQGNIHYYFKSKDELLKRVLEILFQNFITNIQTIANSSLLMMDKIGCMLESGYTLIDARRDEFIAMIAYWAHAVSVGGEMLLVFRELFQRFRQVVIETLEEGDKDIDSETRKNIAMLVVAGVQGLGLQYTLDPKNIDSGNAETFLKDLLFHSINPQNKISK